MQIITYFHIYLISVETGTPENVLDRSGDLLDFDSSLTKAPFIPSFLFNTLLLFKTQASPYSDFLDLHHLREGDFRSQIGAMAGMDLLRLQGLQIKCQNSPRQIKFANHPPQSGKIPQAPPQSNGQ